MTMFNSVFPVPTGGAVGLNFTTAVSGNISLSRATSGVSGLSPFTTLYSGSPLSDTGEACFFLDIGDASPGPLLGGIQYVYSLTDVNGTTQSNPVSCPSNVNIERVDFDNIVVGLLQGAINTATLPAGIKPARVFMAMPLGGLPALPFIALNPDVIEQEYVPIGVDDEKVGDLIQPGRVNVWTQTQMDKYMVRLSIISLSPSERAFYRDFIIATMRVSLAYAFAQFGADLSHSFIATSYQEVDQTNNMVPGFYGCDVLFEFLATANVKITTSYNLINTILMAVTGSLPGGSGVVLNVEVPTL